MRVSKIALLLGLIFCFASFFSCQKKNEEVLSVAISPYQDIAMIVNIENLGLENRYNTSVKLVTLSWEDILPAVASTGRTVDVGFGGLAEYLTKVNNINEGSDDPLLFVYPLYIYRGGGFISFSDNVPVLSEQDLSDSSLVMRFFENNIGAQKSSLYDMLLFNLARNNGVDYKKLRIIDTPMDLGLLATQNGDLDIASAGLTQISEAKKQGGRIVLNMDDMGFADVTGLICKKSVYEEKQRQIVNLIKMWFDCVDYVLTDIDKNSVFSLKYLDQNAATKYTLDGYKSALSIEYFPRSVDEMRENVISDKGLYSYKKISEYVINYLLVNDFVDKRPDVPEFIEVK